MLRLPPRLLPLSPTKVKLNLPNGQHLRRTKMVLKVYIGFKGDPLGQ
jgi:hypothetical protein